MMAVLEGVVMELQDCAFPLLQGNLQSLIVVKSCRNMTGLQGVKLRPIQVAMQLNFLLWQPN